MDFNIFLQEAWPTRTALIQDHFFLGLQILLIYVFFLSNCILHYNIIIATGILWFNSYNLNLLLIYNNNVKVLNCLILYSLCFKCLYQAVIFDFLQTNKWFKCPLHVLHVFLKEKHSRWGLLQFIKPEGIRVLRPWLTRCWELWEILKCCFVQPPVISPDHLREDIEEGGTITALLQRAERKEAARMEGNFYIILYQQLGFHLPVSMHSLKYPMRNEFHI